MATKGRTKRAAAMALVLAGIGGAALLFGGGCESDSRKAGKETRRTVEKSKEMLKEGFGATGEAAKEGIEKGSEAVKEGLDKARDSVLDFKKGWDEGKKK